MDEMMMGEKMMVPNIPGTMVVVYSGQGVVLVD